MSVLEKWRVCVYKCCAITIFLFYGKNEYCCWILFYKNSEKVNHMCLHAALLYGASFQVFLPK